MTSIFNINRIEKNDQLRDKKINALNSIKDYLQGVTNGAYANGLLAAGRLSVKPKLSMLEKHLWTIIRVYKLGFQSEDSELRQVTSQYPDFENNWHELIINANDNKEIDKVKNVVVKALLKPGRELTQALIVVQNKTSECWKRTDFKNGKDRGWYVEFSSPESSQVLREKLAKFDAKTNSNFINHGNWEKNLARDILREVLLTQIKEAEEWERDKQSAKAIEKDYHNNAFKRIMSNFHKTEFFYNKRGRIEVRDAYGKKWDTDGFRSYVEGLINNRDLEEKFLPNGQKKADLLRKLEGMIEAGIKEVSGTSQSNSTSTDANVLNDNASETSAETSISLWDEDEDLVKDSYSDNSSVTSTESTGEKIADNQEITSNEENIEKLREKYIQGLTTLLQKEPVVSDSDLKAENQDWLNQLKVANSSREMNGIQMWVKLNIGEVRRSKQSANNLDNLAQEFQNGSRTVSVNDLVTFNQSSGNDGNEAKEKEAKKAMIQNDSELYFDTFVKWIKDEEEKIAKKQVGGDSDSEIEYTPEERKFLNGEITDQQQKQEIAEQIEAKINIKKKSWSFRRWLKEQYEWLKTKAQLLRKKNKVGFEKKKEEIVAEIKNSKKSSNRFVRQAYEKNKNKAEALLKDLKNIADENANTTADNNNFPVGWVVGIGAVLLTVITVLIIKQRKKISKIK